ncbi:MAG: prepilin peptidase [Candidatus Binataceae bacterium]
MELGIPTGLGGFIAFIVGAAVGSFVNVVAYRLPREISIATPRSFCPNCERAIPWWANIPILAYIGLRGRCIMCMGAIPLRYFLAEFSLAVAALFLFLTFPLADALARFVFCAALFSIAVIDYDWRIIPNIITFPGMLLGVVAASFAMPEVGWRSSIWGLAVGGGVLFATGQLYELVRGREGVGLGDVWLLGMIGAFIGLAGVLFTLFFGSIIGAVGGIALAVFGGAPIDATAQTEMAGAAKEPAESDVSILQTEVPFGPFLALAAAAYTLFQPALTRWYLGG